MKNKRLFYLALAADIILIPVCLLFLAGNMLLLLVIPVLHILLFILNTFAGACWSQTIILGLTHIAVTLSVHLQSLRLHFHDHPNDPMGQSISALFYCIDVIWTGILFVVSLIRFSMERLNSRDSIEIDSQ